MSDPTPDEYFDAQYARQPASMLMALTFLKNRAPAAIFSALDSVLLVYRSSEKKGIGIPVGPVLHALYGVALTPEKRGKAARNAALVRALRQLADDIEALP